MQHSTSISNVYFLNFIPISIVIEVLNTRLTRHLTLYPCTCTTLQVQLQNTLKLIITCNTCGSYILYLFIKSHFTRASAAAARQTASGLEKMFACLKLNLIIIIFAFRISKNTIT